MFDAIRVGCTGERALLVGEEHTASRWASGTLPVFATPMMVALMEQAAVTAVDPLLPTGYQTVGTHLDIRHLAATPVGCQVTARAELIEVNGAKLTFRVEAHDPVGKIGEGTHQRYIIEVERFMQRATARKA